MPMEPLKGRFYARFALGALFFLIVTGLSGSKELGASFWLVDVVGLVIPFSLMAVLVWIFFVPKHFSIDDDGITIGFPLRRTYALSWQDLDCWGWRKGVFALQTKFAGTFQIALFAYSSEQQDQFTAILRAKMPDGEAKAWFGGDGYR